MEIPQQFESYSQRFADHAPYPVFFVNSLQNVFWLNQWAMKRESVNGEAFLNKEVADILFDWGVQAEEVGQVLLCLEGGYPQRVECMGDSWLSVDIDVVYGDDRTRGYIVSLLPRRLGDSVSRGDENVHRLISLMTHEARGQLHALAGFCELLKVNCDELGEAPEELAGIVGAKEQLSHLWSDAEALVELFGSLSESKKGRFSLGKVIREILNDANDALSGVSKSVRLSYSNDLPSVLIGSPDDFKSLSIRLLLGLSRGVKNDTIGFDVSWANSSRLERAALRLDVVLLGDEGLEWREVNEGVNSQELSGLSITIAQKLVSRIGGRMFYKSSNGMCCRVMVDLMFDPSFENGILGEVELEVPAESNLEHAIARDEPAFSKLRMLVVDDNEVTTEVNRKLLMQLGVKQVDGASSGNEALELFGENKYQVAFLDLKMPDMDGFELGRRLKRESEKMGAPLKMVALTGGSSRDSRKRSLSEGFDYYLVKPVTVIALRDVCRGIAKGINTVLSNPGVSQKIVGPDYQKGNDLETDKPFLYIEEWENDPALHRRMLTMLLEDAPQTLKRIEEEIASENYISLRQIVHYFKGSVDVVRADRLAELSSKAFDLLNEKQIDAALRVLEKLPKEYQLFTEYLQKTGYMKSVD
ncbi:response regulator [Puniceicoccaceae bacterium K14]|nr:response regulator [Puniceicoccaceae bacterium K14]